MYIPESVTAVGTMVAFAGSNAPVLMAYSVLRAIVLTQ